MEQYRFRMDVTKGQIDDLHARLEGARWPDEVPNAAWQYGMPKTPLRELASYWRKEFDVNAAVARINAGYQYRMPLERLDIHFVHQRSPHA